MEKMDKSNSTGAIPEAVFNSPEETLRQARGFPFPDAESEICTLASQVWEEEIRNLEADIESLRPQLKYLTDPPSPGEEVRSCYATIIFSEEGHDGLLITRVGTLLRDEPENRFSPRHIKVFTPQAAISQFGLDRIREGLANIFLRKIEDIEHRKGQLFWRLEKLQKSRAILSE